MNRHFQQTPAFVPDDMKPAQKMLWPGPSLEPPMTPFGKARDAFHPEPCSRAGRYYNEVVKRQEISHDNFLEKMREQDRAQKAVEIVDVYKEMQKKMGW